MSADATLIYRATRDDDLIFRRELDELPRERGVTIHYVTGDRNAPGSRQLLSAQHLRALVPDIAQRAIYLCGPPALMRAVQAAAQRAGVPRQDIHCDAFAF